MTLLFRYSGQTHLDYSPALAPTLVKLAALGWQVDYRNGGSWLQRHKGLGFLVWFFRGVYEGLLARARGSGTLWIDETLPFFHLAVRVFFRGRLVVTVCDNWISTYLGWAWLARFERWTLRAADTLIVKTHAAAAALGSRAVVVPDAGRPSMIAVRRRPNADQVHVICFGILHRNKDYATLFEAVDRLALVLLCPVVLDIVGDGPEMEYVQRWHARCPHSYQERIHGRVVEAQLVDLLGRANVNVAIRRNHPDEAFHETGSFVQGVYAGVPTAFASSLGVDRGAVGPGVHRFAAGNPVDLAFALEKLLRYPQWHVAGVNAFRAARSPQAIAERLASVLDGSYATIYTTGA